MTVKRKPTTKDWGKITALYLKGEKPRFIVEKMPYLDISAKEISSRLSRKNAKTKKQKIAEKVEERLIDDIIEEKAAINKKHIVIANQIITVVENYIKNENYKDFSTFDMFGKFKNTRAETINTATLKQVANVLSQMQKVQRLAGDFDKEENDDLTPPVINLNIGGQNVDKC